MFFGFRSGHRRWYAALCLSIIFGAGLLFGLEQAGSRDSASLSVSFFDVGQGDAIFIEFPDHARWLIDGGPDRSVVEELDRHISLFDRRLTGIILTHPHADHVSGLIDVLKRYRVGVVMLPPVVHDTPEYQTFLEEVKRQNIPMISADQARAWGVKSGGADWRWEFLYPDAPLPENISDLNDASIVSRLTFGEAEFLFMGDAGEKVEDYLLAQSRDLKSDILKVGHHGSATATTEELLEVVEPSSAIISAGKNNRFGHPAKETLARLTDARVEILRTDLTGTIELSSDGEIITLGSGEVGRPISTLAKDMFSVIVEAFVGTQRSVGYLFSIDVTN